MAFRKRTGRWSGPLVKSLILVISHRQCLNLLPGEQCFYVPSGRSLFCLCETHLNRISRRESNDIKCLAAIGTRSNYVVYG